MVKRHIIILFGFAALILLGIVVWLSFAYRTAVLVSCSNQMFPICFAGRLWADDHGGVFPKDFLSMSNELAVPIILICPGDHSRQPASKCALLSASTCSYEIVSTNLRDSDTNGVFVRCKIHPDHLGYVDGTVFDGHRRRRKFD